MRTYQVRAKEGQTISYTASASGYVSQSSSVVVSTSTAASPIIINLSESVNFYTVNIVPNISGCTVTLNGQVRDSGTFPEGTTINYTVEKENYNTESDSFVLNQDTTVNVTMTSALARLTVNVNGYDNVNNTTTYITSSSTISFRVNGSDTPGNGSNYIDVTPGATVGYKATCSGYVESGWTYITVSATTSRAITLEKSTNQYTLTWVLTDPEGNNASGYDLTVRVNGGSPQVVTNNTFTGTINDEIYWSASKTGWSTIGGTVTIKNDQQIERQFSASTYVWISDTQNNRISGVDVTFTDTVTGTTYNSTTSSNGIAELSTVVAGHTYAVNGTKTGYHPVSGTVQAGGNVGLTMYAVSELVRFTINPDPTDNDTHVYMSTTNSFTSADEVFVIEQAGIYSCYGRNDIVPDGTTWYYKVTHPGYNDYYGSYVINRTISCLIAQMTQTQYNISFAEADGVAFDLYIMQNGSWVQQTAGQYGGYTYVGYDGEVINYKAHIDGWQDKIGTHTVTRSDLVTIQFDQLDTENYLTMELTNSSDRLRFYTASSSFSRTIEYLVDGTDPYTGWTTLTATTSGALVNGIIANTPVIFRYDHSSGATNTNGYGGNGTNEYVYFTHTNYTSYNPSTVKVYGKVSSLCSSPSVVEDWRFKNLFSKLNVANKYNGNTLIPIDMSDIVSSYGGFYGMFQDCSSLTDVPTLKNSPLYGLCYAFMFKNCTGITSVSTNYLPQTTLADSCYSGMFQGCSHLVRAPKLPATTLVSGCYRYMFQNCSSLNYVECNATSLASQSTYLWLENVSTTGTFDKNYNMSSWPTGSSGIPNGWTVT